MTIISKSIIDTRTLALVLFGIGPLPFIFGLISFQFVVFLAGLGILLTGLLFYFFGRCSYTVSYDEQAEHFNIANRKEHVVIKKNDVIRVREHFTLLQSNWPFPSYYYHTLIVKNHEGKKSRYRFVIWSNEPELLKNYERLARSIDHWKSEKHAGKNSSTIISNQTNPPRQ